MKTSETIEVKREPLLTLLETTKRYLRRTGGASNGNQELVAALDHVARDVASAELRAELERPLPMATPAEEEPHG